MKILEAIERSLTLRSRPLSELLNRKNAGCAMRALESVTGAQATEEEWALRLDDLRLTFDTAELAALLRLKGVAVPDSLAPALIRPFVKNDDRDIYELVTQLSQRDTPLGKTL